MDTITQDEAIDIVSSKLQHGFVDRAASLIRWIAVAEGHPHGDHKSLGFTTIRVNPHWPLKGSISITREDGARFHLKLSKSRKWKAVRVN